MIPLSSSNGRCSGRRNSATRKAITALTLVELLVVVVIIAVLAAIIFPIISRARASGFESQDIEALKQIGTAREKYASDYDSHLTPASPLYTDTLVDLKLIPKEILADPSDKSVIGIGNEFRKGMPAYAKPPVPYKLSFVISASVMTPAGLDLVARSDNAGWLAAFPHPDVVTLVNGVPTLRGRIERLRFDGSVQSSQVFLLPPEKINGGAWTDYRQNPVWFFADHLPDWMYKME